MKPIQLLYLYTLGTWYLSGSSKNSLSGSTRAGYLSGRRLRRP